MTRRVALACVVALVAAAGLWLTLREAGTRHVTAYFPTAIGLYEGNSVRVLGVDVGDVERVEPQGERVKVTIAFDGSVQLPANAHAVIVAPSLVSDRYVQFTPAYTGGPQLPDGAVIEQDRTAVPLEIDDLYDTLIELSDSLGPQGANKDGSLSRLLRTLARNFKDNGSVLNATIGKLSRASGTLAEGADDLFGTVSNLAKLTKTVAAGDDEVRRFQRQVAKVAGFLADERHTLAETVELLGTALGKVHGFITANKDRLRSNVDKLADVTQVLVEQRAALAEIFDIAPVGLANVINTYNGASGTIDARANLNEFTEPPLRTVCTFLKQKPEAFAAIADVCEALAPIGDGLPALAEKTNRAQKAEPPPLPLVPGGGR